jgi:hypothetical protein
LGVKAGQNLEAILVAANVALIDDRLLPFAKSKGIHYIAEMVNAKFWSDFRNSWRNLENYGQRKAPNASTKTRR